MFNALGILSTSSNEFPTFPPSAFIKVKAIPPPIIILSALLISFSRMIILSDTFAPPKMAVKGLEGLFNTRSMFFISPAISIPKHLFSGKKCAIVAVDACAR